jgi:iron complex outermembrane receptor protein
MKKLSGPAWLAISTSVFALGALPATSVAQSGADEAVEEIITLGTRRQGRTAIDTAVPIDVFNQEELDSVSSDDLIDVVRTLVPSFNVSRQPISDGSSFIRPPQMRGLDSDKTLVLVNGKRRHRAALVVLGGFGSHGPDLATIPSIALKSVEVLRDGAGAQYGSDAIAGVLNFNLKDAAEGGEARVQVARYTEDDNATQYLGALNFGFGGDNSFVNTSLEIAAGRPTSRGTFYDGTIGTSGLTPSEAAEVEGIFDPDGAGPLPPQVRYGPDALTEVYDGAGNLLSLVRASDDIPDDLDTRYRDNLCEAEIGQPNSCLTQIWGDPDRDSIRMFVNAGIDLNNSTQLYGWGNYSDSNSNTSFFHRDPDVAQLAPIRLPTGDIYNPRDRYPSGFTPRFFGNVIDASLTAGLKGEWNNGMSYDFSGRYGENTIKYKIINTLNPSMGPASPTKFRPGSLVNDETEFGADFSKGFDVFQNGLNVAFGVSYRDEGYTINPGDDASAQVGPYGAADPWDFETSVIEAAAGENGGVIACRIPGQEAQGSLCIDGDPINTPVPVGSNGFPGYGTQFITDYSRSSYAVYGDLESDITDNLLLNVAGRFEDYSDFGNNFSWKIAGRYRFGDAFTLRSSVGTGFRAPTGGQISTVNVSTRIADDGTPVAEGIFPPGDPVSSIFGGADLTEETSQQFTLGFTTTPTDNLTITLDYYFIALDDRIVLTSQFDVGPAEVLALEALGVPGAATIAQVRFFTNDVDTETQGVDLVANYNWDWAAGNSSIAVAANWNDTEVTDPGEYLNDEGVYDEENGLPSSRANITLRHTWENDITFSLRGNYYGSYNNVNDSDFDPPPQNFGAVTQFDFDVTWDLSDTYRLTIGGNNIFNDLPDVAISEACCGRIYASGSVMDWQGPQYYVRGTINW